MKIDPVMSLAIVTRLLLVCRTIALIELISSRRELRPGGVLNWKVLGLIDFSTIPKNIRPLMKIVSVVPYRLFWSLIAVDVLTTALLFVLPSNGVLLGMAACLLLLQMKRHYMSYDGADELTFLCLVALAVGNLLHAEVATLYFLAAEACLAYFVAGIYKLFSPYWRNGQAILQLSRTRNFGQEDVARLLEKHPKTRALAELGVVAWETTFPIVLLAPPKILVVILLFGFVFHLSCAWIMNLNTFIWAFGATYPAVIFANGMIRSLLGFRVANELMTGIVVLLSLTILLSRAKEIGKWLPTLWLPIKHRFASYDARHLLKRNVAARRVSSE